MRVAIILASIGASWTSSAYAQSEMPSLSPTDTAQPTYAAPAPEGNEEGYSFTGLRVEFLGGYNRQLPAIRTNGPVTTTSRALRHSGGSAGIQGGYDVELGPVVVGVFGGYSLVTSQGCGTLSGLNRGCLRPQGEAEGGVRVGLQLRGRLLGFVKGSYVNTRIQTTNLSGTTYTSSHINKDGWRVGGGFEFAVTQHAYVKTQYNYTRTERFSAAPYGFQNTRISYRSHAVLGGFGVRF